MAAGDGSLSGDAAIERGVALTRGARAGGPASHSRTHAVRDADLDRVVASVRGWETRLTQLAPGRGRGSVFETELGGSRLVSLQVDAPVALEALPLGSRPDALFHVGTICFDRDRLLWQGLAVPPCVLMLEQGRVPSSFALPAGCELLVARLDRERIASLARRLHGDAEAALESGSQLRPQHPEALAELRAQLRVLARGDPAWNGALVESAERDLHERVASMLAAAPLPVHVAPATRRRALRRAEEYMHAHARERVSLAELCIAADCSERTLRQVFRECYGTSPTAFLRRLRLQGLRQELRDAAPRSTTVLDRALRWGFWHMGHLARDYRALFGEAPSETLSRESVATDA